MEVNNKRIIVTGGASGIGKQLVIKLINRGAYVSALDINEENLLNLKKYLNNERLFIYKVDISSQKENQKFKKQYLKEHLYLDILINNAGIIQEFTNIENLSLEAINKVMNINFYGAVTLIKEFLPDLKTRPEGYIVNVGSMGGFFPFPSQTAYGASKAALGLFTEGLYSELLNTNIKVTLVIPGAIATDIVTNSNVKVKETSNNNILMTSAEEAAFKIIDAIKKEKWKIYIGRDAKFMNLIYKVNACKAIKYINKLMNKNNNID